MFLLELIFQNKPAKGLKVKIWSKLEFFALFGMELKKSAKMRKGNILLDVLSPKSNL